MSKDKASPKYKPVSIFERWEEQSKYIAFKEADPEIKALREKAMQEDAENMKKFHELYTPEQIEEMRKAFRERIARKRNGNQ